MMDQDDRPDAMAAVGEFHVVENPVGELNEGDLVQVIVQGDTMRLARLDKFLRLRGALAEDKEFDRAMEWVQGARQKWTPPPSF